jgi:hypothetical protein
VDTEIVKQGYGALIQINPMTVWNIGIDSHVIGCLFLLFFVYCLSFAYMFCIMQGRGILPIRLVYSPEGRGVGDLSWPLSGSIQYDYKQTNHSSMYLLAVN